MYADYREFVEDEVEYGEELRSKWDKIRERPYQFPNYHLSTALTTKNNDLSRDPSVADHELPPGSREMRGRRQVCTSKGLAEVDPVSLFTCFLIRTLGFMIKGVPEDRTRYHTTSSFPSRVGALIGVWTDRILGLHQDTTPNYASRFTETFDKIKEATSNNWLDDLRILSDTLRVMVLWRSHMMMKGKETGNPLPKDLADELKNYRISQETCNFMTCDKPVTQLAVEFLNKWKDETRIECTCETLTMTVTEASGKRFFGLMDIEHLLSWSDMIQSRWVVGVIIYGTSQWEYPAKIPLQVYADILRWGDYILARQGNSGYKIIKHYEGVLVSQAQLKLNNQDGMETLNDTPEAIIASFMEDAGDLGNSLIRTTEQLTPHQLIECMSFFRFWGHPIIDVQEGLEKLHLNCTLVKHIDNQFTEKLASDMARVLLSYYYWNGDGGGRHCWPEDANILKEESPILFEHIRRGSFPSRGEIYMIGDVWHKVQYKRIFDEAVEIPLLDLIGDKSHSMSKDELKQLLRTTRNSRMASPTKKLIISILKTKKIDPIKYLDYVNRFGFTDDELIIGLRGKEREMKLEGRFFSLMSFALRLYFVSTEYLANKYILPLFPEITMGLSGTDTMKMMCDLTSGMSGDDPVMAVLIHLDYEKWNNHQRHEANYPIFREVDKAFGWQSVFSLTHLIFQQSFIYYVERLDRLTNVGLSQLPFSWRGQKGGLEGLRQKMWTVVGALLLRRVGMHHNQKFSSIMQGDNQVVIAKYNLYSPVGTPERQAERVRLAENGKRVLKTIALYSQKLGLTTKIEETWISSSLLVYGKYPIIKGESAGMFLKIMSRLYSTSNDATPSITNVLSSTFTNGLTSSQRYINVTMPMIMTYWYGCLTIGRYMRFDPVLQEGMISMYHRATQGCTPRAASWNPTVNKIHFRILLDILFRDSILGGLGGCSPLRFFVRDFPDALCESVSAYRVIQSSSLLTNEEKLVFLNILHPSISSGKKSRKRLLESPYSLSITTAPHTKDVVKHNTAKELKISGKSWVANVDFNPCLNNNETSEELFVSRLFTITPCLPNFLSAVYSNTSYGVLEGLLNRISGPSTILSVCVGEQSQGFWQMVSSAEEKSLLSLYHKVFNYQVEKMKEPINCSATHCQKLRDDSWGLRVVGVTVPHPIEQIELIGVRNGCCAWCENRGFPQNEYVQVVVDPAVVNNPNIMFRRGSGTPYLGSATVEKRAVQSECEATSDQAPIRRLLKLLDTIDWFVSRETGVFKLLGEVASSVTDCPVVELYNLRTTTSGCALHRFFSDRNKRGGFSACAFNAATHLVITGDTLNKLNRDSENYIIVFQSIFLFVQQTLTEIANLGLRLDPCYHVHFSCPGCLIPAEEITLTSPNFLNWGVPKRVLRPINLPGETYPRNLGEQDIKPSTGFFSSNEVHIKIKERNPFSPNPETWMLEYHISQSVQFWVGLIIAVDGLRTRCMFDVQHVAFLTTILNKINYQDALEATVVGAYLEVAASCMEGRNHTGQIQKLKSIVADKWASASFSTGVLSAVNHSNLGDQIVHEDISSTFSYLIKSSELNLSLWSSILGAIESMSPLEIGLILERFSIIIIPTDMNTVGLSERLGMSFDSLEEWIHLNGLEGNFRPEFKYTPYDLKSLASELSSTGSPVLRSKKSYQLSVKMGCRLVWSWPEGYLTPQEENPKRWLRSPIIHFIRLIPELTSAWYKIADVFQLRPDTRDVMVIGDGNGGFSSYLVRKYPFIRVFFNSILEIQTAGGETLSPKTAPSFLRLSPEEKSRIVNWKVCTSMNSDLTSSSWAQDTVAFQEREGFKCDCIVSDVEIYSKPQYVQYLQNLSTYINLSERKPDLLLKTHWPTENWSQSPGFYTIRYCMSKGLTRVLRSRFSNPGAGEVYVDCRPNIGYEGPPCDELAANLAAIPQLFNPPLNTLRNEILSIPPDEIIPTSLDLSRNLGILFRIVNRFPKIPQGMSRYGEDYSLVSYGNLSRDVIQNYLRYSTTGKVWNLGQTLVTSLPEITEIVSWMLAISLLKAFLLNNEPAYRHVLSLINDGCIVQLVKNASEEMQGIHLLLYAGVNLPLGVKGFSAFKKIFLGRTRTLIQEHLRYMGGRFWTLKREYPGKEIDMFFTQMGLSVKCMYYPMFSSTSKASYLERWRAQIKGLFSEDQSQTST
ncbi:polymerase [Schistocephalus solidus rhabdovirus]|uniref:Replicase n=1 Tax=Schistocephalus solidus rhabdovirus TaxID=2729339 RepID=A0A6M3RVZ4_9RHAB|nr:polymerase [Schistocephalus solidus rhabdovirus]